MTARPAAQVDSSALDPGGDRSEEPPADGGEGGADEDAAVTAVLDDEVVETNRWTGATAVALLVGGLGVWFASPAALLLVVVPVAYAAYARRGDRPAVSLSVERSLQATAAPGETVEVTVEVTNEGRAPLWDLRLVDEVPGGLAVADGSPRLGTALRPGRSARFSYEVTARRGSHAFDRLTVLARDLAGTHERRLVVRTEGRLTCLPDVSGAGDVPLRTASSRFTGRVPTATGGEGIEFFATREYRPGDSPSRVDWNRFAATRELATLEFRRERAATVVLLVDARETAHRSPARGEPSALSLSVDAAGAVFGALLNDGDRVGLAGFGPESCWLPPGAGTDHREHGRRLLATHGAFSAEPPGRNFYPRRQLETVRRRAPTDAQFVVLSPAVDDYVGILVRRLQAFGHPVTLVSPDVTTGGGLGRELAAVERRLRLTELREADVRVVDWAHDEPLAVALDRAAQEWSP